MTQLGRYRTFVQLDPYERWILRLVQRGVMLANKKKRPQPTSKIIGMIIRDYWEQYEESANPELLAQLKKEVPRPKKLMTMSLDKF